MSSKVIVLGGGVAGLSAAHELIKRGFQVEVFEKNPIYYGGKARSIDFRNRGKYENPLPGEHGFRFFPGFYKHVTATMKEIPLGNGKTAFDNLTPTTRIMVAQYGKKPIVTGASFPRNAKDIALIIKDLHGVDSGLTKEEETFFAERVWQLITSCRERRNNDYERLGWWQYLEADRFSKTYQHLLVEGLTRTLVAAQAEVASTKTGGDIFLQLLFCMTDPSVNTDRVLNKPTNDAWLYPWVDYLKQKGVVFHQGVSVNKINVKNDEIDSVEVKYSNTENTETIKGDYYIMCMPVERAAPLISDEMTNIDKRLNYIKTLATSVSWMNGIQYYLNVDVAINKGHIICSDTEWAITCISQVQFWNDYSLENRGPGNVKGILSVDISDWFTPGKYTTTKCANECTRDEVADEVWAQLKASLNFEKEVLKDAMRVDHYLDRDIYEKPSSQLTKPELEDMEPLLVNSVNSWDLRPDADCDIPNLFFAGDYVRTNTDLATMEGANEAARRAVNCIIDKSGNQSDYARIWNLKEPFCFSLLKWYDLKRYKKGLPWTGKAPWYLKVITVILGLVYFMLALIKGLFIKKK